MEESVDIRAVNFNISNKESSPSKRSSPDKYNREVNMIYENELVSVEVEESEIPWVKVFTQRKIKEFSECTSEEKLEIFRIIDFTEKLMLSYFNADKINIASFGNMLPHVHWHVMARFEQDSYFPEPMWGAKQRESQLDLPSFEVFFIQLGEQL
jgi:diadenosine tetraphosphate (Ap4A) HIT family hydrolase